MIVLSVLQVQGMCWICKKSAKLSMWLNNVSELIAGGRVCGTEKHKQLVMLVIQLNRHIRSTNNMSI